MAGAGWFLIVSGVVWVFVKTGIDFWAARNAGTTSGAGAESVTFPGPDVMAKLLQAPYGVGVAMMLIGATLLLASGGVSVDFSATTPTPTPTPTS